MKESTDLVKILHDDFLANISCYCGWTYEYYRKKYNLSQEVLLQGLFIKISGEGKISIGDKTYIGDFAQISVEEGTTLSIGKNCAISHRVGIYTSNRVPAVYDKDKILYEYGDVIIGDNCLLGINSTILQGVSIGENSFIGAGAVVTKDIPAYSVAVGVPAKVIKTIPH